MSNGSGRNAARGVAPITAALMATSSGNWALAGWKSPLKVGVADLHDDDGQPSLVSQNWICKGPQGNGFILETEDAKFAGRFVHGANHLGAFDPTTGIAIGDIGLLADGYNPLGGIGDNGCAIGAGGYFHLRAYQNWLATRFSSIAPADAIIGQQWAAQWYDETLGVLKWRARSSANILATLSTPLLPLLAIVADAAKTTNSNVFADLAHARGDTDGTGLTLAAYGNEGAWASLMYDASFTSSSISVTTFQLWAGGIVVAQGKAQISTAGGSATIALRAKVHLPAGATTAVKVRWKTSAGTATIDPTADASAIGATVQLGAGYDVLGFTNGVVAMTDLVPNSIWDGTAGAAGWSNHVAGSNSAMATATDGKIRFRHTGAGSGGINTGLLGLRTAHLSQDYTQWDVGAGVINGTLYKVESGVVSDTTIPIAVGTYIRLSRNGTTGAITCHTSTDGITWTLRVTFAFTSVGILYPVIDSYDIGYPIAFPERLGLV